MSQPTLHDGELIERALAGQHEAFGEIVARYERALRRLAESRLNDAELARDAVQETFLNALRSLRGYNARYSFRTWLWTILLNECKRLGKREQRSAAWSGRATNEALEPAGALAANAVCPQAEPAAQASAREQSQLLHRCLNALPEAQADALRLRFFGELTFPEIAAALSCSVLTAKNRVRAGLTRLAAQLRQGACAELAAAEQSGARERNLHSQHLKLNLRERREHPLNRQLWHPNTGEAPRQESERRGGAEI